MGGWGGGVGGGFFFNDTATTEIYTLSLHDALPILDVDDDPDDDIDELMELKCDAVTHMALAEQPKLILD